jgi:pimeloyl-ACP methyl ester carboxylesterase
MRTGRGRALRLLLVVVLGLVVLPYVLPLPGPEGADPATLARPSGAFVEVDGSTVYMERMGPADGPAAVLIHGLGGSTFGWRNLSQVLAEQGMQAVAVDLRGFGLSERDFAADHSHPAQARLVAAILDGLAIERVTVIAHSMGGSVALHLALQRPEMVERMILVAASANGRVELASLLLGPLLHLPPVARWGRHALRGLGSEERVADILASAFYDPNEVSEEIRSGYLLPFTVPDWDLGLLAIMRDAAGNDLPRSLDQLDQPALLIWGAHDRLVPVAEGEALVERLPNARLEVLSRAGHLPFEDQPADFARLVLDFLDPDR